MTTVPKPEPRISAYRIPPVADVRALLARVPKGVQLVRADRVYGADHLRHAAALAQRAIDEGRARTADVATETALYAAGERQIGKALAFLGLQEGVSAVAVVAWAPFAPPAGWIPDGSVLDGGPAVLDAFGVTETERAMLPRERWGDLVLERVALTDVLKT
jgi:tRNA threonylcarbamoyladenosine modification (KEOPS) complex Cgi121 subunit